MYCVSHWDLIVPWVITYRDSPNKLPRFVYSKKYFATLKRVKNGLAWCKYLHKEITHGTVRSHWLGWALIMTIILIWWSFCVLLVFFIKTINHLFEFATFWKFWKKNGCYTLNRIIFNSCRFEADKLTFPGNHYPKKNSCFEKKKNQPF